MIDNTINSIRNKRLLGNILLILLFISPIVIFLYLFPSHWAGWFILFITYFLPIFLKPFSNNKNLLLSLYLGLTVHHVVAFINSYIAPTLGATKDAIKFNRNATLISEYASSFDFSVGSHFYVNFLAAIYKIFGSSKFLGSELSVLAFLISLIFILKVTLILKKQIYATQITLLYGLLPTVFLFTSVTMREAYQMMFLSLSTYFSLKIIKGKGLLNLIGVILCLIGLGIWHNGLMAAIPIILMIIILFSMDGRKRRFSIGLKLILSVFMIFIIGVSFITLTSMGFSSSASESLASGDILSYTEDYRDVEYSGGSTYGAQLNTSSLTGVILSTPWLFFNYMFAPFPWQLRNLMDLYTSVESLLRLLLIIGAIKGIRKSSGQDRKYYLSLFLIFILIELIWSMGTLNWGTAMRHHLIAYGLILVIGIEGLLTKKYKRKIINKP